MPGIRVGLIRHFEVLRGFPRGWLTADDLQRWRDEYDSSPVIQKPIQLDDTEWNQFICSDIARACETARCIHPGPWTENPNLREAELASLHTGRLRLPFTAWRWIYRLAWMTSHRSQHATKGRFLGNLRAVVSEILAGSDRSTLIVSHAGVMMFLRRELISHGFMGPEFDLAEHGRLYVFEKAGA